jgi:hypothetical protein
MRSAIQSGSISGSKVYARPWWASYKKFDEQEIPIGTLAIVKSQMKGLLKHEWENEIVVVLEKIQPFVSAEPWYKVVCHKELMIVPAVELKVIE